MAQSVNLKPLEVELWGVKPKSETIEALFVFSLTPLCSLWALMERTAVVQGRRGKGLTLPCTLVEALKKTCRPPRQPHMPCGCCWKRKGSAKWTCESESENWSEIKTEFNQQNILTVEGFDIVI